MKRIIFLFVSFFFHATAQGFLNIESLRQTIKPGFSGSSGANLSGASGNQDIFEVGGNSRNIYKKNQREYIFITEYRYGEASGLKNANQGNAHIRYAQGFTQSWQWETFGQVEFNEFQSLKLRTLLGGGLRKNIFRKESTVMHVGLGTFYEDETVKNGTDQANFRGNLYLSLTHSPQDKFEIVLVSYYQPSLKTVKDERIQFTAGLELEITNSLNLINSLRYARDSRPPSAIETEDFSYNVGFNLDY